MTTEEFNALPLEARRFIETHAGCLSCGNPANKLTRAYELYKAHQMAHVYQLFGGGINYVVEDKKGVLYNVKEDDTPFEIREKLALAEKIFENSPHVFISYDKNAIKGLLESLPAEEVIDLRTDEEKAADEAKAAAEAEAWTKRAEALGIDTKTADYPALQSFAKEKGLNATGKKKEIVKAIDALDVELL